MSNRAVREAVRRGLPWLSGRNGELEIEEAKSYIRTTRNIVSSESGGGESRMLAGLVFALADAYILLKEKEGAHA